jgi:serine/threonine protein kinase
MPIEPITAMLIHALESLPKFEGRYENLKIVNVDPVSGVRQGVLSLVFRGFDTVDNTHVAIKFFDPARLGDSYRLLCFERESDLLEKLPSQDRLLRLLKPQSNYLWQLSLATGVVVPLRCPHFVLEWVPDSIDDFFLSRASIPVAEKLSLYSQIVLAVEALHNRGIFHRDLKPDNIRLTSRNGKRVAVVIDLGTAARVASPPYASAYMNEVGAPGYSPCEARCGLAGNRRLAPYTDYYALGCLLFELFNSDLFYAAQHTLNPGLDARYLAIQQDVRSTGDEAKKLQHLHSGLDRFALGVAPVPIDGAGSTCDPAVASLLNDLLRRLTQMDYRHRAQSLTWVRERLQVAIVVLNNETEYQRRLRRSKEMRRWRIAHAKRRDERLHAWALLSNSDAK